jgi:hypothetical protein
MAIDPRELLPRHKSDCEHAHAIIALGYPAVAPVLRELLEWLQDGNWPVSHSVGPFLASIGEPVIPLIREVFRGNDNQWKYWCIDRVVMGFPPELAEQLRQELQRIAFHPSREEKSDEVDERASVALEWLDTGIRA